MRYDNDAAEAVEEVLRAMFKTHPKDRAMLFLYWMCMNSQRDLADALEMPRTTLQRRINKAEDTFADFWDLIFYRG